MSESHASIDPIELREILNASASLLRQNRPGEAAKKLLPIYEVLPEDVDVAINLGGAYILQRKWRKAISVLEDASKRHADNVMVWTNLAAAYLGRLETSGPEHQKRAIGAYERALLVDPKTPNVHYHLGLIYADRKELEKANENFHRALEVNPLDRDAQRWIGRMKGAIAEQQRTATQKKLDGNQAIPEEPNQE